MSTPKIEEILNLYGTLMEELKQRSILLGGLVENKMNLHPVLNFEFCQLQIRKICEIVALACLTAHNEIPEVKERLLQKEYNAEKILKHLSRLHPSFYPIPHLKEEKETGVPGQRNHFIIPKTEGFITKEELIGSYNECGNYLHRGSVKGLISKRPQELNFLKIQEWNNKVGHLLAPCHFISLIGGKKIILCVMNNVDNNNKVQCVLAEARDIQPSANMKQTA